MTDRNYILNLVKSRDMSIDEFNYDKLIAPPINAYFSEYDLNRLTEIAQSIRYSAKPQVKYQEIDLIMKSRGFVKLSAGTNRIVYKCIEDDRFVAKVAYDYIGMSDNPREFINQSYLKPFCTKIFEVSRTGVLAFAERVNPITNREEFLSVAEDIFTLLTEYIIGEYVLDDCGTKYFMNYGLRRGFGPVILDFTYLYKLDGNKLFCCKPDNNSSTGVCGGELDYDDGYNNIICKKCGCIYRAKDLELKVKQNMIVSKSIKGEFNKMKVTIKGGTKNVDLTTTVNTIEVQEPKKEEDKLVYTTDRPRKVKVSLGQNREEVTTVNNRVKTIKNMIEDKPVATVEAKVVKEEEPAKVEEVVEKKPVVKSPIKEAPVVEKKTDRELIRDGFLETAKKISSAQLGNKIDQELIDEVIKGIKFNIDTLRDVNGWNYQDEIQLFSILFNSKKITVEQSQYTTENNKIVAVTQMNYNEEEHKDIMYMWQSEVLIDDTTDTEEEIPEEVEPATEIEVVEDTAEDDEIKEDITDEYEDYYDDGTFDDYENEIELSGYIPFKGKFIDIATKLPKEESKIVLVIENGQGGYITIGDGSKLLVVDNIDNIDSDNCVVVSKEAFEKVVDEVESNTKPLTEDILKKEEAPTVNGVASEE